MPGDYTRFRYNPIKNTSGVQMQQGRVLLDQDWNEAAQLEDRRWRAETIDIIGRAVVPIETKNAFQLLIGGPSFTIGNGRMYVDGLVAENHGVDPTDPAKRVYNTTLGELDGVDPVPYEQQPYFPDPPAFPADGQPHLVYLDVWQREVTYLEDPSLIDPAVAVDTVATTQTVWQVKVLEDTPAGTDCSTPPDTIPSWVAATARSAGRLTTAAAGVPSSTDPCIVPANGGYRGSGNRCYRVEIHTGGPLGTAQFKWSRDNASVATAVTNISAALDTLTVALTRRDSVLRFQPDDWVEITDDHRYFHGLPGEMRQVAAVGDVDHTIRLATPLPAGEFDPTDPNRHTRVIRWDQRGIVRDTLGNAIVDVDTNGGLIPVPPTGTTLVLEDGIQLTFSIDPLMPVPNFNPLDYWMFAARVIDASVEILNQAPPHGILHHYAWIGFVTLPGGPATDCRIFWPPAMGESCDCTACVTAESHNNNTFSIQAAINQVAGHGGGKVCLGPGVYNIIRTISIAGATAIEISGHGMPSLVAAAGFPANAPLMVIEKCLDITVEDVGIFGPPSTGNQPPVSGIVISNSVTTRIQRCVFNSAPSAFGGISAPTLSPAIGLNGYVMAASICENTFTNVDVGVGAPQTNAVPVTLLESEILDNHMTCTRAGVALLAGANGQLPSALDLAFTGNTVRSAGGFLFVGSGVGVAVEQNFFHVTVPPTGAGPLESEAVRCSASDSRIAHNVILGEPRTARANGIVLIGSSIAEVLITENQIANLTGSGIVVRTKTVLMQTLIARNQILNLGEIGILAETGTATASLTISENRIAGVGRNTPSTPTDFQGAILLQGTINLDCTITGNTAQNIATGAQTNPRIGILVMTASSLSITGNQLLNIGSTGPMTLGFGIAALIVGGRLDIFNNEVRRAVTPPLNGDASPWSAVIAGNVVGHLSIRGNILESFGNLPTVALIAAQSCIFSENRCFLDNPPTGALPELIVKLGIGGHFTGGAIIAANNFLQAPPLNSGGITTAMTLNPEDPTRTLTVTGNITSGQITVGAAPLGAPWAPLNVRTS